MRIAPEAAARIDLYVALLLCLETVDRVVVEYFDVSVGWVQQQQKQLEQQQPEQPQQLEQQQLQRRERRAEVGGSAGVESGGAPCRRARPGVFVLLLFARPADSGAQPS